jgi:hypothetical protein
MTVTPPALATWLLNNFTSGPNSESLIGDLIERYLSLIDIPVSRRPFQKWRVS